MCRHVIATALCLLLLAAGAGLCGEPVEGSLATLRPGHQRPFFMPRQERERILGLVAKEPWAKAELERVRAEASKGNGFWAGFLYALEGKAEHLETARNYLVRQLGPKNWAIRTYTERLADPNHFKAGQPHLADVYYGLGYEPFVVYDWVRSGLSEEDRRFVERGIQTLGRYRMGAMDRWTQTPNLVFKPTFMTGMAGLALQDAELMRWGFFRTKPHGARIGGYFPALEVMLLDGGPWLEAPIYPVAHQVLWCSAIMSRYGRLYDGRDWFRLKTESGDSAQGLMDYYLDTACPVERTGHGAGQVRVITYGDGATNPKGDMFLVNPAGSGLNMEKPLVAAYNASGDPRCAAFVGMIDGYRPDLWNRRPLPAETTLPPAPSKIWPNYGLAMLRSDESSAYWTSGKATAVFQLMSQGYGHDHRDKFAIMLHGAGRLLYPDYNAIQYESSSVGWTRHSCSHSTLLVDEQDTANAQPTGIRHEFSLEVKYLATSASGVFEGVEQTRALMLTREYLLDVFHASSGLPHTYDYLLHCLGEARPLGGDYRPVPEAMPRYWVIEDKRQMATDEAWSIGFTSRDEPGSRGGKFGPEWYGHEAHVRVSMAAAPGTHVVRGVWGARYAAMVGERHRGKQKLDRLASLVVRRTGVPATAFIAVHEPYANAEKPQVRRIEKLAETHDAVLVRIDGADFTDYAALSYGPQEGRPLHALSDGKVAVQFRDCGYVRVDRAGRAVTRGRVAGLRIPGLKSAMTADGKAVAVAEPGVATTRSLRFPPRCPLEVAVAPARLRVWTRDRKTLVFTVRNTLKLPVAGHIAFELPKGFLASPERPAFGPLEPRKTARVSVEFSTSDPTLGKHTIPYQIAYDEAEAGGEVATMAQPLVAYAGPTIEQVYQFPKPPVYRAVTSHYTAMLRMSDGAPVGLADDADQVRLDGEPLFLLSEGEGDPPIQVLGREPKTGGVWVGHRPANLVAEASGRDGKRHAGCRWQAIFMVNRILFRMDAGWTQFEKARFVLPGNWLSPGGKPRWARVVTADGREVKADGSPTVSAALLEFPGSDLHMAFQFNPAVPVTFRGAGLEFRIGSLKRENWSVGFCRAADFDRWRGKP